MSRSSTRSDRRGNGDVDRGLPPRHGRRCGNLASDAARALASVVLRPHGQGATLQRRDADRGRRLATGMALRHCAALARRSEWQSPEQHRHLPSGCGRRSGGEPSLPARRKRRVGKLLRRTEQAIAGGARLSRGERRCHVTSAAERSGARRLILIHRGGSDRFAGSAVCQTVRPSQYSSFLAAVSIKTQAEFSYVLVRR